MTPALDQLAADATVLDRFYAERPNRRYMPGRTHDLDGRPVPEIDRWQLQFHMAPHVIRTACPGNGAGKSTVIACEIDWWNGGGHPWPHEIPYHRPRQCIWIAQKHQQWEFMKKVIEPWWPRDVVASWRGQPHFDYTWPDGSTLSIITSETHWTTVQGIEPDLVVGDEEIPPQLAREMRMRRRSNSRTRFVFNGTATQGISWVYRDLYLPWKAYHEARGIMDEREMMRAQLHDYGDINPVLAGLPGIWCWPQGGHYDNPTATRQTWAFYQTQLAHFSSAERAVRAHGGFRDFASTPVFNLDALERMRKYLTKGVNGFPVESGNGNGHPKEVV